MITKDIAEVIDIAKAAGEVALSFFRRDMEVREKANKTPVSEADIAVEKAIVGRLRRISSYPVITEESPPDEDRLGSEYAWLIDPIDGTSSFIDGSDEFTVSIGLAREGRPYLGVVYRPVTGTIYFARRGRLAYRKEGATMERLLAVSKQKHLADAVFITRRRGPDDRLLDFVQRSGIHRFTRSGSGVLRTMRIAEGEADITLAIPHPGGEWDICAAEAILSEAGGVMCDALGNNMAYNKPDLLNKNGVVSTTASLQRELMRALKEFLEAK